MNMLLTSGVKAPAVVSDLSMTIGLLVLILTVPIVLSVLLSIKAYRKAPRIDEFDQPIAPADRKSAGALKKATTGGVLIGSILTVLAVTSIYAFGPFFIGQKTLTEIEKNYNVTIVVNDKKIPVPLFSHDIKTFYTNTEGGKYPLDVEVYPKGIFHSIKCRIYSTPGPQLGLYCPINSEYIEYDPDIKY